jgi:hypothetical protein
LIRKEQFLANEVLEPVVIYIGIRLDFFNRSKICLFHTTGKNRIFIHWIAVGNPARILSPDRHDEIWEIQKPLNFPLTVYGIERPGATMEKITRRLADRLGSHIDDEITSKI